MGLFEQVSRGPAKMTIVNVDDPRGSRIIAQFNPTEFTESVSVEYSRQKVVGLSHQPLQYVNTGNDALGFDLFFNAEDIEQLKRNMFSRKFLLSVAYPRRTAQLVTGGGPPRLMFIWPGFISLTCVLIGVSFTYQRFAATGHPLEFTASVTLEEIRDIRLLSDEVLGSPGDIDNLDALGTVRGSGGGKETL